MEHQVIRRQRDPLRCIQAIQRRRPLSDSYTGPQCARASRLDVPDSLHPQVLYSGAPQVAERVRLRIGDCAGEAVDCAVCVAGVGVPDFVGDLLPGLAHHA